jgi:hypothetical protein
MLVLSTVWLGACTPDKETQLALCHLEALRTYAHQAGNRDVDMPPIINEYVITCMDAAGYELAPFGTSGCALSEERNIHAACYLARGSRDWWKRLFQ